ncbi:hypothetical protein A3C57_00290 [Candidatus Nomurabacteria bacterium RIFCSPHIGHO2_02_FULL_33_12]|uniref:Uncharacterized protein n=1 Tax=Candidatus Nomurabacteria bacterium RIFCSPLOWO2_01_FULL_33_17 TaxID=1801764 RepID=A0A1F6WQZ6_9BACT|nr:MAG: hypothetical protein A3C57_00290 [Candidatus Nomurabacteria bacterium RIFCSPHIGHO2_02_FULL_33_12]OGI84309.1 MAG: hypothetical protein A2903_01905 [Candidatus Nomurabacteria bacterium RIFCSPLOWO2_01_FULL_33_17]
MHRGRLIRIILIILILGMGGFLIVRNISLKKQLKNGEISNITSKDFLPFGGNGGGGGSIIKNIFNTNDNEKDINEVKTPLIKIHDSVAGSIIVNIPDEIAPSTGLDKNGNKIYDTTLAIRYVTKENGFVYDYIPKYQKSYLISDTPIPKVSFAHFSPNGNTILFQYLDIDLITEKSILGTLGNNTVTVLPNNIISYAFSKNGKFVYVQKTNNGAKFILKNEVGKESVIYESELSEWNVNFLGEENLLITTKASEYADGFSYIININNKTVKRLWTNVTALTTKASLGGNFILRGETEKSGPKLSLYNVKTGELSPLGKMGMVEKCSFSEDETTLTCAIPKSFENRPYPDDWYLGIIETNDGIIRYTTQNKNTRIISDLEQDSGNPIDVLELKVNNSGSMTIFINKKTSELYLYEE